MVRPRITNRQFFYLDLLLLALTPVLALSLRLGVPWDPRFNQPLILYTLLSLLIKVAVFYAFGLYRQFWPYASVDAVISIVWAVGAAGLVSSGLIFAGYGFGFLGASVFPRSLPVLDTMLTLLVVGASRLSLRAAAYYAARGDRDARARRVLIAGAGEAGRMVAREIISSNKINLQVVGFADDDPAKIGTQILGVPVLGPLDSIPSVIQTRNVEEVLIAMASVDGSVIREVDRHCRAAGVRPRVLPGLYELMSGEVSVSRLREVRIDDLLRRRPVTLEKAPLEELIRGKRVLVTGAAGSIGGELCRQICQFQPAQLLVLDQGENRLFLLAGELEACLGQRTGSSLQRIVADVRDRARLSEIFDRWKPEIVFHAAAYKHVPLLEENLVEAVTNNIEGTLHLLESCRAAGVERFVFLSTDKAVEPVSVMGMTKRVGEKLVREAGLAHGLPYVSVRFGNVLGSRGSVVPLFQRQIADGGPVTVTHPEVTRYFMSLSEAVGLVLQAAALGEPGGLYYLEMGEPVRIKALAQQLIELSGLQPGEEIEIQYTGLRPGEKLAEKLYNERERVSATQHPMILRIEDGGVSDSGNFHDDVRELIHLAGSGDSLQTRALLADLAGRPEHGEIE